MTQHVEKLMTQYGRHLSLLALLMSSTLLTTNSYAVGPVVRATTGPVFTSTNLRGVTRSRGLLAPTTPVGPLHPIAAHSHAGARGLRFYGYYPRPLGLTYGSYTYRQPITYIPRRSADIVQVSTETTRLTPKSSTSPKVRNSPLVRVLSFSDGTNMSGIIVGSDSKQVNVRLLGVRTAGQPAAEATAYLNRMLEGEYVIVQPDATRPQRAHDGTPLVQVYSSKISESLNADLIRKGLAVTDERIEFSDKQLFLAAQAQAQAAKRGAWNKD